jgi:hypothetical protein
VLRRPRAQGFKSPGSLLFQACDSFSFYVQVSALSGIASDFLSLCLLHAAGIPIHVVQGGKSPLFQGCQQVMCNRGRFIFQAMAQNLVQERTNPDPLSWQCTRKDWKEGKTPPLWRCHEMSCEGNSAPSAQCDEMMCRRGTPRNDCPVTACSLGWILVWQGCA